MMFMIDNDGQYEHQVGEHTAAQEIQEKLEALCWKSDQKHDNLNSKSSSISQPTILSLASVIKNPLFHPAIFHDSDCWVEL